MELAAPCGGSFALQKFILLLGKNAPLILVFFIIWKILKTFTVWHVAFELLQRSLKFLFDPRKCFSKAESVQQKIEASLQETKTVGKGTTEDGVHQTPYQRLRQLLCKELACQVCLRVAQEAWQLIYWQRTEHCGYAKSRFRLSPRPCKEAKVSTATSVEEEQESCIWTSSVTSACVGPVSFGPEGTASTDTTQHVASVAAGKKASKRSLQDQKTQGSVSGELDVYMEDLSSLSSSTYETSSISSWTDSSGHSTLIFSRLKSCRSRKHHKSVLQKQKSSRSSPKQASPEAAKGEEIHFPSVPVSFMKEAMIQSLESHWVAKRLQHLLGMSWILLRSLRSFMPSAPASSSERPLGVRVVVRRPRVLAFVAAKTKKKLELHLKKRVQLKLWQLPRRVQEALRHMKPLPLPKSETSLVQKPGKKAKRSVVTGPPLLQRSLDVIQMKVKLHLAKKCVEIQAEVFPDVALRSWRLLVCSNVQPLPKLVSRADKPLQARLVFLPFVLPQDAKKMEMVVQRWRLSSCWDLGKRYVESLVAMAPPPSSSKPFPCRREASEFSGAQTPFLQQGGRETLEAHVRKKRLQHEWGLPSVIRRSLKAFMPSIVPRFSVLHKTRNRIETLPQKLAFLPEDTCILLEFHLQRLKLQQRWGLPRRVLETCRRLFPELLYKEKRVAAKPFSQQPRLGIRTPPGHLVRPKKEEEKVRKNQGLPLCPAQPLLMLKTKVLKKLQVHLTKKHLEVRLESFPAAPQISWKRCWWSQRQPLPKLILPGLKTPQIRIFCSSCGLAAMSRIESALQRGHLASLWGLGLKYMEAVTEMATIIQQDAERPHPSDGTREFGFQFAEGKTPFFQPSAREVLEMHLRKKRIQHQWGLPFMVQRSLRNFSGHMSPLRPSKAVTQASIFPQELLFLPPKVTNFLEFHLQRMKLQQRWGLPRRVLQSCRCLFPELFYKEKTKLLVKHYSRKPGLGIKTRAGGLVKPQLDIQKMQGVGLCPAQSLRKLSLQALKKLEVHLTKKHLEVRLETFPALSRISWRCVWLSASQPLPKLILPGLKTPQTRSPCLFFDLAAMGRIEVALQRGRLVSLWGLGLKYVEILAAMCPGGPLSSVKFKEIPVEFSEVKSLFFKNAVRENLEMHVKKKRLQHEWGYSTLVQRSLRSLIGEAPNWHRDLPKEVTQISLLHLELHFLSETVKQNLELHLQRLKLQRRWDIPQKVHRSVKFFHSLVPEEKPQATFGETQVDSGRWEETNALLPKNKGCLEDLLRYTLETHLKKKSLEIKFQLIGYKKFSGPIKHAFLPKCSLVSSEIKPRPSCLYFVEQDVVEKMNLNIKHKQLMHLWGLPSIYTKSLNKMFGNVIVGSPLLEMSKLRRWTLEKNVGQENQTVNAMGSRTKELRFSRKGPCFVQTEILDLLEMHVRRKKLQHEWGLPSMVQKSLQAFALEPEQLLEGFGIAITGSWGVLKVTIKITTSLFFVALATQKLLEAHMKNRTAAHRWGLPKRVQESLKMFLPPASHSQVEGDQGQAKTPWHAYNRLFQTASKQRHKAENIHHVTTVKRALPKADFLGKMSQEKVSRSGREKMALDKQTTPMSLKQEDLEFMGLHVQYKRIQHEWGLPALVHKSLQAFAPVPPEPQKRSFRGLQRLGDGRKTHRGVQVPSSLSKVLVAPRCLHFFSQDAKDRLESHVKCWTREHKWGLPQLIQDSLRAMVPPPQVTDEKPHCERHLGFHLQEAAHTSHSRREGSPSWKEATIKPMKNIHQRKPDARTSSSFPVAAIRSPEVRLLFYIHTSWDLLEFHVTHKKIQHAWGLPSAILKSLRIFAPFPLDLQKHTRKRTQRSPRDKADLETKAQQLWFLNTNTQEHLETSVRTMAIKHKWEIPKRIQHSFHPFLPPLPSSQVPGQSVWPCKHRPFQDISSAPQISVPLQKAKHHLGVMKTPPKALPVKTGGATEGMRRLCPKIVLSFLPIEERDLLEFHIQRKKIQHAWGLPLMVLRSLHVFAPYLLQSERTIGKTTSRTPRREIRDLQILSQELNFLSIEVKQRLEAHLRHRTSAHRWGLPERVQQSLRAFLPPGSPSRPEVTGSQPHLLLPPKSLQTTEDIYELVIFKPEAKTKRTLGKPKSKIGNKRQRATGRPSQTKAQTCFGTKMVLSFLAESSRNLLEFHIQRKKIQHAWGLPSMVLRSLHVFAPYLLQSERTTGKITSRKPRREKIDVQILSQDLLFLSIEVKERLEAHLRHRTSEHRWGLPERVWQSLRAFLPPGSPSHPGMTGFQPLLPLPPKSLQKSGPDLQAADIYEPVLFKPELKQKTLEKPKSKVANKRQRATGKSRQTKVQICSGTELSFLPESSRNLLEFHIQWKRIQHAWGLPSTVLKSLQAFAPHLFKAEKITAETVGKFRPRDRGEVQILSQDLDFLSVDVKELLEAHLRHLTSEHRWGLPERVQRSLSVLLPPRSPSCFEMTGSQPLLPYLPLATSVQPSRISNGTEDPQILPPSSPSAYTTRDYMSSVENIASFQKVKIGSGRTTPRVKNKMPLPGFKAKMVTWQMEDGSQRTTKQRGTPVKPSAPSRELKKSPKISSCLSCHSSAPKKASISSSKSDRQPKWPEKKKKKKQVLGKRGEAVVDDSSLLAEDNEAQDSPWSSGDNMAELEESSGDNMTELEGSSGDNMSRSSLQESEAAKMYYRPWEAHVQPYHAPISQQVSYFFPHHVLVPNSCYEDVVARCYRHIRRGHHARQSSRLQRRGSRLTWREFLDHSLEQATRCQTFFRTQLLDRWFSDCERFLYLQHPSSSRGKRSSTEDQDVQPPKESRKGLHQNQDFVRTDVELQVHHESCSLTLKTDSKEEGRKERVTFSIAKEQSLLSLKTLSQGSTECKVMREDDWDQGRRLEVKWEDQNKGAEESFREEMGSWTWANSSVVRQPPLAEDSAPSLVALSEEARVITGDRLCSGLAKVVVGSPKDHGVLKPSEIPEGKDVVIWQKRQIPVDLMQAGTVGQKSGVQCPLPRRMRPISCSPGRPPKAGKKKQVKVNWSSKETHQERLVIRRLAFDPKLSQTLEVPRQGAHKRPQEQRSSGSEKMTILGNILEKKLNLQQGLSIWRQSPRPKEEDGRGRKRDKREGRGGQGGRPPQPPYASVDKQSSTLSSILQGKLHLCRNILKGKLCFWKKSQELSKTRRTGKYGGVQGKKLGAAK
ncbi:protein FAM205A [Crotalus tigris]|uniref:protein FAM205A n=1 Tax=Crotalus tigris TaxID=88082 RepID=UPI00192F22F7|nr:protein FAM205A [Crotalus tigris]